MTQWETIHDQSSHISPVRLVQAKNYSTERGNGIFEAVSKSFIPTTPNISRQQFMKKPENNFKSTMLKLTLILIILCLPVLLFWQCYTQENSICQRVDTTLYTQGIYHVKRTIHSQVTQTLASKAQVWVDLAHHSVYTPSRIIQEHYQKTISPILNSRVERIKNYWLLFKREYNAYVNQRMEYTTEETIIEEKVKKTAKWILEYIDQTNLATKTGMKKEDAKEKAQEIIKSITQETNVS